MRQLIHGLIAALALAAAPFANAAVAVGISVNFAPPVLPVYVQPPLPEPGYIWVPGYWAWGDGDYYWVPGTWEEPPSVGLLWTPGYWGFANGLYVWNGGYWGPEVGFYGGVDYGYGYHGVGYEGGYWRDHRFYYNRAVNNFGGVNVTNVYTRTVVNNVTVTRVSYNGGAGGVRARPTAQQMAVAHEHHVAPTTVQREHETLARNDQSLRAKVNGGHPPIAATARPTSFKGPGVVAARDARPVNSPAEHNGAANARNESERAAQASAERHPATPEPRHEAAPAAHPPVATRGAQQPENRGGSNRGETRRETTPAHAAATSRPEQESRPGSAEPQRPVTPPRAQSTPRPAQSAESRAGTTEPQRAPVSAPRTPAPQSHSAPAPRPQAQESRPAQPPQAPRAAPQAQHASPPASRPQPQHEAQARPQGHPEGHPQQPQRDPHEAQGH
jgi:hypothetical protein